MVKHREGTELGYLAGEEAYQHLVQQHGQGIGLPDAEALNALMDAYFAMARHRPRTITAKIIDEWRAMFLSTVPARTSKEIAMRSDMLLDREQAQVRRQEPYLALVAQQHPHEHAMFALAHRIEAFSLRHCDAVEIALQDIQRTLRAMIAALDALPPEMRPHSLLLRLRFLYRSTGEALALIGGVRGLCEKHRLVTDPTGSYWQLRDALRGMLRERNALLALTEVEVALSPDRQEGGIPADQWSSYAAPA